MKRTVIYITKGDWAGALAIVEEERTWGIVGYMPVPHQRGAVVQAPVRVMHNDFDVVGEIEVPK
jgi:hypothetical protein